jgi:precorrin-8X/cobalt-precorrin-8 methylmutase
VSSRRHPVHPIEAESYRLMAMRLQTGDRPPLTRAIVERVVHATADLSFADSMVVDEQDAEAGRRALAGGAPVVTDVEMVRAGIAGSLCYLAAARAAAAPPDAEAELTLSARGIRLAAEEHPDGAVFAIGCAPTALDELISLVESGAVRPAFVVGVPVGFVGAAESKARLRESARACALPLVSNLGERGGSAVAAAVVNALRRLA